MPCPDPRSEPSNSNGAECIMPRSNKIKISNNISEIQRINNHIAQLSREWKLPNKTVFDITITIEEIVTNIINYGSVRKDHFIIVTFLLLDEVLVIQIQDDGGEFNPLEPPDPDGLSPEDREKVMRGLNLAEALSDSLRYTRKNGINTTLIQKKVTQY